MQRIYWIGDSGVGIGPHPDGDNLDDVMKSIRDSDVDVVVSLQPLDEATSLGLVDEKLAAESQGIVFFRYPIPDHHAPPFTEDTFVLVSELASLNSQGKRIFIHCYAGIGRSATIAAGVLIKRGMDMLDVLETLKAARGFHVPETFAQLNWIQDYADLFQGR